MPLINLPKTLFNIFSTTLEVQLDIIPLSKYLEAEYIQCTKSTFPICEKLCNSPISCMLPLDPSINAKSIDLFRKHRFKVCNEIDLSAHMMVDLLTTKDHFSFSYNSLELSYDDHESDEEQDFLDFSDIDNILEDFRGIFQSSKSIREGEGGTFIFSPIFRKRFKEYISKLCPSSSNPIIIGKLINNKLISVKSLCKNEDRGLHIFNLGENCDS